MADYTLTFTAQTAASGDDIYAKPVDGDFSGVDWGDDAVAAIEIADTNTYSIVLDETKGYIFYLNAHSQAFTANTGTDVITAAAHGLLNGETVRFKGADLPAGLSQTTVYFVRDKTDNTFKVALTAGGAAVNITDTGSGTMTITSPAKRSKAGDGERIASVPQVKDTVLTGEGEDAIADKTVAAIKADADLGTGVNGAVTRVSPTAIRTSVGLESANLASLVQAVIGKKNVTDNGNGTYDIAIRNTTDTTTLITIRHNPVTGATTVV